MDVTLKATNDRVEGGERRAVSVKELAKAYGVSPGLIRLEIGRKRLRVRRIGRRVVIPIEAITEWLEINSRSRRDAR